jgi:KipI family sensor histidine kinase inhibitor
MMQWTSYGPDAWLLHFAEQLNDESFARGRAIVRELRERPPAGLLEFVPAFTSVLLEFAPGTFGEPERKSLATKLTRLRPEKLLRAEIKEIPVCYSGPDLERVATQHKLRVEQVIQRHVLPVYKVYALGFSPGFPYLGDLDPSLHTPRLSMPRPRVQSGSVAIGGIHTGIYSVTGPGGWNIIGYTPAKLYRWTQATASDVDSETSMFFLRPGERVKFVSVDSLEKAADA